MKLTGKKILVISPDFPYPPNHGGRVDIWNRIKALKRLGFEIDLIATVKSIPAADDIRQVRSIVNRVICCPRKNRLLDMFSRLPLQSRSRKKLSRIPTPDEYDIALLETEYVYSILANRSLRARSLVLRIQNNEKQYFRELCQAAGFGISKLYYYIEALRFEHLWQLIKRHVPHMMFISRDEYGAAIKNHPDIHAVYLPPATANGTCPPPRPTSGKVLFIGSFFMVNNREALSWFIKNVHPLLCDIENYEFIAAGNSRLQNLNWLHDLAGQYNNITIHDSPEQIHPFYRECGLFVNPMLHGAGVKLKTIDAVRNGLPVVSTTVGNQGTGLRDGEDILIADDPEPFAAHIKSLLTEPDRGIRLALSAQQFLKENYDQEAILGKFFTDHFWKGDHR